MFHYDPGRESVPTYNREEAAEKFLSTLQKTKIETFDVEKNFIPEECHTLQADCEEILDIIVEARKIQGKPIVTIMADRGQGFFQICEWIFPPKYNPELDRGLDEDELAEELGELCSPVKKRSLYQNGGRFLYQDGGSVGRNGNLN